MGTRVRGMHAPMRKLFGAVLVMGAGLARAGGAGAPTPPRTPPPPPPQPAEPGPPPPPAGPAAAADPAGARALMQGHFARAASAHDAIVRADMDTARADMAWLATHQEGDALPENLQPLLVAMQAEAARFAEATTLTEAGTAYARTLVRCGACHTASHGGPEIAQTPIPEGDTPEARMRRHQWASDRMFDGLVMADPAIFRAGNEALTSAPLTQTELPSTEGQPAEQVVGLTTHVRQLGAEAATAADDDARAGIYGRYLATCGTCHRLLEGGAPAALEPSPAPPAMPQ